MDSLLKQFSQSSQLGANAAFIEDLYEQYLVDPDSVGPKWKAYFDGFKGREAGDVPHSAAIESIARAGKAAARGAVAAAGTVAARRRERGRGSIVAVGSNAASAPRTGMAAYAASKAAATQYLRCLALELAPFGVRCNIVSPGSTDTAMQRAFAHDEAARGRILRGDGERFRLGIPLGRIADPCDVADTICFLLSDRARHVTLHDLRVDGGATLDM